MKHSVIMRERRCQVNTLPPIDPDRFEYPAALAPYVGLSKNTINFLKKKGCKFVGKKTTLNLVRRHLGAVQEAQGPSEAPSGHLQH